MKSNYSEKLRDPRWQKKRLEILNRDNWTCQYCGDKENTLHVHHRYYIRGNEPWEYRDKALITLCCDCHQFVGDGIEEAAIGEMVKILKECGFLADEFLCDLGCAFSYFRDSGLPKKEIVRRIMEAAKLEETPTKEDLNA